MSASGISLNHWSADSFVYLLIAQEDTSTLESTVLFAAPFVRHACGCDCRWRMGTAPGADNIMAETADLEAVRLQRLTHNLKSTLLEPGQKFFATVAVVNNACPALRAEFVSDPIYLELQLPHNNDLPASIIIPIATVRALEVVWMQF